MNKAAVATVQRKLLMQHLQIEWTDWTCCTPPPRCEGPKHVSIYPTLEEFRKLQGKAGNEKADLQSTEAEATQVKIKIGDRVRVP